MNDNKCVSVLPNECFTLGFTHTSTRRLALLPSPRTCTERSPRRSNEVWTVLRHQCLSATHHKSHRPIKTNERYVVFMLSRSVGRCLKLGGLIIIHKDQRPAKRLINIHEITLHVAVLPFLEPLRWTNIANCWSVSI